jgi:hypothetical protein
MSECAETLVAMEKKYVDGWGAVFSEISTREKESC